MILRYDNFKDFRQSNLYSDVSITVNGKTFSGHRVILAAKSTYFNTVFTKANSTLKTIVLQDKDIDFNAFQEIALFIYTGEITLRNSNIVKIYKACNLLGVECLSSQVTIYLESINLHIDDMVEIYQNAIKYGKEATLSDMLETMAKNIQSLCDEQLLNMPFKMFRDILSQVKITNGDFIIQSISKWIKQKPIERKVHLGELLKMVDLKSVNSQILTNSLSEGFAQKRQTSGDVDVDLSKKTRFDMTIEVYAGSFRKDTLNAYQLVGGTWKQVHRHFLSCTVLRTARMNGRQYFLEYSPQASPKNTFWMSSLETGKKRLTRIPKEMRNYHLTNIDDTLLISYDAGYGAKENRQKPFRAYYCDLNQWFEVPDIPTNASYSAVTAARGLYFVIGGNDPFKKESTSPAFCYDRRLPKWTSMPYPRQRFLNAVACTYNDKVYVYERIDGNFEVFDPVASKWESLLACPSMTSCLSEHFLVSYRNDIVLMDQRGNIKLFDFNTHRWLDSKPFLPNIFSSEASGLDFSIKDVITF